jgi:hypothetical protein
MPEMHVLFVPWERALGSELEESTALAADVMFAGSNLSKTGPVTPQMKLNPVAFKHPSSPHTTDGMEYEYKNKEWLGFINNRNNGLPADSKKSYFEVWYTGKMSILLMSMRTGVIYLRGHCMPNQDHLLSGNSKLQYDKVADRLFDSGLPTGFAGKIKCYNCHSGEGGDNSFLALFSKYMYNTKGYKSCQYIGYEGALDSMAGQSRGGHKLTKLASGKSERAKLHQIPYNPAGPQGSGSGPAPRPSV